MLKKTFLACFKQDYFFIKYFFKALSPEFEEVNACGNSTPAEYLKYCKEPPCG